MVTLDTHPDCSSSVNWLQQGLVMLSNPRLQGLHRRVNCVKSGQFLDLVT